MKNCKSCEYSYLGVKMRRNCEIEDKGKNVPLTLKESMNCEYWERKGSRDIINKY